MANLRNEFEFKSGLLDALGVEHTEADAKVEERWRAKMLDGLGVEYNQNDVNQFDLFRAKLLEGIEGYSGGGGGTQYTTIFDGIMTTEVEQEAPAPISAPIEELEGLEADTIKVTFNGVEYVCELQHGTYDYYGANPFEEFIDWSDYPFSIVYNVDYYLLATPDAGTYTLKIEEPQSSGGWGTFKLANIAWANLPATFDDYSGAGGVLLIKTEEGFADFFDVYEFNENLIRWDDEWATSPKAIVTVNEPTTVGDLAIWLQPYLNHDFRVVSGDAFEWDRGVIIYGDCTLTISGRNPK